MSSPALELAILLRQQVRDALDRDDMPEVCRLNRLADAAYLALDPWEASAYGSWVFGRMDVIDESKARATLP